MRRNPLYIIRGADGHPEAIHQRIARPNGSKVMPWWTIGIDGKPTDKADMRRPGFAVAKLPLFGSQHVAKWDTSRPVFVVEGEKDTMALLSAGYRALGAVGGAAVIPDNAALAVLIGFDVVLWADADAAGWKLMQNIAGAIRGGVKSLQWVDWQDAPPAGGADDYLAAGLRVEDLVLGPVPMPEPVQLAEHKPRLPRRRGISPPWDSPIARFNDSVTVTDVLRRDYGLAARPGRAVRCPWHEDRHPSLSILADDRRVYCHAASCWAHNDGRGRDAWDLAHAALEVAR